MDENLVEEDHIKKMDLVSDSIHCASCVNLIEKTLINLAGVQKVRVNLTKKRITVEWDNETIKLGGVMDCITKIGHTAHPYEISDDEIKIKNQNKSLLYRIAFAGFAMMNMMWITVAMYSGAGAGQYSEFFDLIGLALATPTLLYSGWPFLINSIKGLMTRHLNMDLPIAIGAISTYLYSTYVLFGSGSGGVFFDTVVNFIFIILIGRYLESRARERALMETNNLRKIEPRMAAILINGVESKIGVFALDLDDIIIVRPGEIIAVDGEVVDGSSGVDESIITGESMPIYKKMGDQVISGSIITTGSVHIKVNNKYKDSTLNKIIDMTENVKSSGLKIVSQIDKIIPYFIGITLSLSLATFIFWAFSDIEFAIMSAVSVLIITCPCALGLATPMAVAVASGIGAGQKILFKDGMSVERLSSIDKIVFDKTGTLTNGKFEINNIITDLDTSELLKIIGSIEKSSEHPISKSIIDSYDGAFYDVKDFIAHPGLGVEGTINGETYRVGNVRFLQDWGNELTGQYGGKLSDNTNVLCATRSKVLGMLELSDTIKDDAVGEIKNLKKMGYHICIISGDQEHVVKNVADEVGISEYYHSKSPKNKMELVASMGRTSKVLMVGDGVNDAPALKKATVSISYSTGYDLAGKNSDIVSLGSGVKSVGIAINLSKVTTQTIKQNIYWAVIYNIILVPMAVLGMITPLFAAIAMPISSIVVISNAGLMKFKMKKN